MIADGYALLDLEDGGDAFFWNVGSYTDYTALMAKLKKKYYNLLFPLFFQRRYKHKVDAIMLPCRNSKV
jgi:hypothetical protein